VQVCDNVIINLKKMVHECHGTHDDASSTISIKKAIGASLFILFVLYTAAAVFGELKKKSKVSITLFKSKDRSEFAQASQGNSRQPSIFLHNGNCVSHACPKSIFSNFDLGLHVDLFRTGCWIHIRED